MALKDTSDQLKKILCCIADDLEKAGAGNRAAAQRVRTCTIKFEKKAKLYRKESVKADKTGAFKKAKKATKAKPKKKAAKKPAKKKVAKKKVVKKKAPKRVAKPKKAVKKKVAKKKVAKKKVAKKRVVKKKSAARKRPTAKLVKKARKAKKK